MRASCDKICKDYQKLFRLFLSKNISVDDFLVVYFDHFKGERRVLDDDLYDILETAFGDADSYTSDIELLAKNPDFYMDEMRLRERIKSASIKIEGLLSRLR